MTQNGKSTPRERPEQRAENILQAATQLFASLGFNNTSTRKIAELAGVSEGTVFNYYSNKNELLIAIIGRHYDALVSHARQIIQDEMDTRNRLLLIAANHLRAISADNALLMRLIQLYFNTDMDIYSHIETTAIHQFNQRYSRIFDSVIKEGIQRGDLKADINPHAIRDLFFGGLEYGMRTLAIRHKADELENYVAELVEPIWLSIAKGDSGKSANEDYERRLAQACRRVEKAAAALEKRV